MRRIFDNISLTGSLLARAKATEFRSDLFFIFFCFLYVFFLLYAAPVRTWNSRETKPICIESAYPAGGQGNGDARCSGGRGDDDDDEENPSVADNQF